MEQPAINRNFAAQINEMSYEESKERRRSRSSFRTTLDVGMGLFYVAIGIAVMVLRAFGTFQIRPEIIAYVLGAMMIIGGCFRFYRGLQDILRNRK